MLLERIYDKDLAQASYFVGCPASGEAIVVDPRRDVGEYIDLAQRNGMRIVAATETHIHADYLSGTRELAAATGAHAYVSGEGGDDWQYGFDATRLSNADTLNIGNITIEARHTPGHTPEHLVFLITDRDYSSEPGYLLTGDFVFAGDLGRPDLLDEAADGVDTRYDGARQLFASLNDTFLALPDHVMAFPAHGAGSACGKALGALPATTVGYERLHAWWAPYLRQNDEEGFIAHLLDSQPDAHAYFARMKRQNRDGPTVVGALPQLTELANDEINRRLQTDAAVFVDTRAHTEVHHGTVDGALNVPAPDKAASFGAWAWDPERDNRPLILLAPDMTTAQATRDHLLRVGIDHIAGFTSEFSGLPMTTPKVVSPEHLDALDAVLVLDVRNRTEHAAGHIPDSVQLSAGRVLWHLADLPTEGTIVTYCQSGKRNSVVASTLRRAGYDVAELVGSYEGWIAWRHGR